MTYKKPARLRFDEDGFDMEKTKRGMSAFALAKRRNRRARIIFAVARCVIITAALAIFLLLFYLFMEVVAVL